MSKITLGLLALLCLLSLNKATAQETESKTPRFTKSLKLHYRLPEPGLYLRKGNHRIGALLPAIEFATASGNFHEFGLNGFSRSSTGTGVHSLIAAPLGFRSTGLGLRYDYAHQLFKEKDLGRFKLYAGFGVSQDFTRSRALGIVPEESIYRQNTFTTSLDFVPRIRYDISKRFSLEASMPINVLALSSSQFKDSPSGMEDYTRTFSQTRLSSFPLSPQFKLGLVFRF